MALFSEEYIKKNNLTLPADFSIEGVFHTMKEDTDFPVICEGFGIVRIINKDDDCYLLLNDGAEVSYEELIGKRIKEKDSLSGFVKLGSIVIFLWGITNLLTWFFVAKYATQHSSYSTENVFGVVNSLFSGLALAGIIYTIILQKKELKLQRKELRLTREELKLTRNEFSTQNETLRLQRFENTFFQMLTLHHDIVEKLQHNGATGRDVFSRASEDIEKAMKDDVILRKSIIAPATYDINEAYHTLQITYDKIYKSLESNLSHYYRNLYHIFKFIYNTKFTKDEKQHYATLVRSQLSHGELHIIYYNSLTSGLGNPKFLFLVSEYDLMQNFGRHQVRDLQFHEQIFNILSNKVKLQPSVMEEREPASIPV